MTQTTKKKQCHCYLHHTEGLPMVKTTKKKKHRHEWNIHPDDRHRGVDSGRRFCETCPAKKVIK